jgi:hypothetical protein
LTRIPFQERKTLCRNTGQQLEWLSCWNIEAHFTQESSNAEGAPKRQLQRIAPYSFSRILPESGANWRATDFMAEQHIDLNLRERREFPESLTQTIRDLANGKKPSGVCTSISKAIAMTSDQPCGSNEFFVQLDNLRTSRELNTRGLIAELKILAVIWSASNYRKSN